MDVNPSVIWTDRILRSGKHNSEENFEIIKRAMGVGSSSNKSLSEVLKVKVDNARKTGVLNVSEMVSSLRYVNSPHSLLYFYLES